MKSKIKVLLLIAFGVVIGFSVSVYYPTSASYIRRQTQEQSSTRFLIPMKVYQQETEYSCGGAVVKSLLDYYGLLNGRSESDLSKLLKTGFDEENKGTHPDNMVQVLKDEGLEVISGEGGNLELIYHYLKQGAPIIVLDSTWGAHWRTIVGYDDHGNYEKWEDNDLIIADPEHKPIEANIDNKTGLMTENEWRFAMEWFENRIFERPRDGFYIVAYPKEKSVVMFEKK
jgi:predicted double-glycine peptidase